LSPELQRALKRHTQWFGSYKASGELKKIQVWLVVNDGQIEFLTPGSSCKVKRVRRNPRVICYVGSEGGPTIPGTARIITDRGEVARLGKSSSVFRLWISIFYWPRQYIVHRPMASQVSWRNIAIALTDPPTPKLAHLDGLNLSRAWMLGKRLPSIMTTAEAYRRPGLAADRRALRGWSLARSFCRLSGHKARDFSELKTSSRAIRLAFIELR
jgi:hypothetical protein